MCPFLGHKADAMEKVCEEDLCNLCLIPLWTRKEEWGHSRAGSGLGKVSARSKMSLHSRLKLRSLNHPALRVGPQATPPQRPLISLRAAATPSPRRVLVGWDGQQQQLQMLSDNIQLLQFCVCFLLCAEQRNKETAPKLPADLNSPPKYPHLSRNNHRPC